MTSEPQVRKRKSSNGELKSKKRRCVVLNCPKIDARYMEDGYKKTFRKQLTEATKPFPHWQLRNFVDNSSNMIERIEEELQNFGEWNRKENDLYSLYQSHDFKSISAVKYPTLYSFRQFLYNEVREWLQETSGVELIQQVDCNGSCYAQTDSLLPHNDLIETRRFAFVYYLTTPNWDNKKYGGNLQLFNSDAQKNPTNVAVELAPHRNSLVLFEVSEKSWHRVSEILSDEPRLSINGWFHSTRKLKAIPPPVEKLPRFVPSHSKKLAKIVNSDYLAADKQSKVQGTFADSSELNLTDFLVNKLHSSIYSELSKCSTKPIGPPSKRLVARIGESELANAPETEKLVKALKSNNFVKMLENMTGVTLQGAECNLRVSRVEHGTYWVLGDEEAVQSAQDGYCLDVHVFVNTQEWPDEAGGDLIYIAEDDEEELLRVTPSQNCAAVVFREPGVMSFMKFVNCKSRKQHFFLFTMSYYNVQVVDD